MGVNLGKLSRQVALAWVGLAVLLAISATLNVLLVFLLVQPAHRSFPVASAAYNIAPADAVLGTAGAALGSPTVPAAAPPTNAPPPFHWSQIESEDYRQYIANLRAVGCPEQTIRDLIAADVSQLFAARARAVVSDSPREYWRKPRPDDSTPEQHRQLRELEQEHRALLRELLGTSAGANELQYLVMVLPDPNEAPYLFLPEDRREAVLSALRQSGLLEKQHDLPNRRDGRSYAQVEKELQEEKDRLLASVLSPVEFTEYRLRNSPLAEGLRHELQYFNCTPEEFLRLLEARERGGNKVATGDPNRGPATAQVRELLGEERAREFEKVTDYFYVFARGALERLGQPTELADDGWLICHDARKAAERLVQDRTLTVAERQRRVRELQAEAERRLNELLGTKASGLLRQNLNIALQVATGQTVP
jgi:hypothetical protein